MEFGILRMATMDQTLTNLPEPKISLVIVGAQKAATTSLKNYLGQHPLLQTHPHKEFSYFVDAKDYAKGFPAALKKYYKEDSSRLLIAKSAGLYASEPGVQRFKQHNPDCRLVLILRNPVERTYSSYLMEKNYGAINGTFDEIEGVLKRGDKDDWRYEFFIGMSLYCQHLEMIYRYFPKNQVKLVRYEEFSADPARICSEIFSWMKIDPFTCDTSKKFNVTNITRSSAYGKFVVKILHNQNVFKNIFRSVLPGKMDYKVGEMLRNLNKTRKTYAPASDTMSSLLNEFYAPYNNKLSELTGMDFSDWNKSRKKTNGFPGNVENGR